MALENIEDIYRLSPVQQGMLFHTLAAPGSGVYFEQFSLEYGGGFDPGAFVRAWQRVVDRHPVLRTSFLWEDLEQPVQVVHRQAPLPVDRQDWRGLPAGERDERLRAYAAADRRSGFDIGRPPLLRLGLIRTGEQEHHVVWSYHHLLLDGWSAGLAMREVFACYREETAGTPAALEPRRPYKDYVDWLLGQDLAAAGAYWRRTLTGFTAPTPLGVDTASPGPELESGYALHLQRLPAPETAALKAFAQGSRLTLNTLIQGAWALLLARYSGEDDVVFGVTVSGRPPALPGAEAMIGCFINTLPVRVRVVAAQELAPWLRELQGALAAMRRFEHSPLAQVLSWSELPRPLPLFESIVVFESFTAESAFEMSHSGVFQRTNYPLTLVASPGTELTLRVGYETGRFGAAAVERLLRHLETLLGAMAAGGARRLAELPLLSPPERHQVLLEWNATGVEEYLAPGLTLHGLIAAQVTRTPEAMALIFEEERLTYRELDARANRLARQLRRLGVGPEAPVGVCLERSVELVVALLGILRAGGAYVPLDPSYPAERLAWTLADACRGGEPPVLLLQERLLTAVPEAARAGLRVVLLESGWGAGADEADPAGGAGPDHAAYVIYTSGSTGRPKGAVNTHRGIVNRLLWMQATYRLTAGDRVLQKTPFSFDVSVWEFFWPLLAGARLVVARPGGHQDPAYLARLIVEQGITTLHFVPPMLRAFLDEPEAAKCTALRRVICSGEALPADLVRRFHARLAASGAELHNLYGPTEAAVDVTFWPCEQEGAGPTAPIGRPVANTQIRLLDAHLAPVPIGVPGELHIGGVQLARGYHGRPALTAEKFIPDSFSEEPGARLYATGDLARYGDDGAIEFLGRIDHQVKVRGVRVELGEIEAVLGLHPAVRQVVVMMRGDSPEEPRLAAYLVCAGDGMPPPEELRGFLRERLPEVMVPAAFVRLERLPLLPNGKLDRRALPAPDLARPVLRQAYEAPRTAVEQELAAIWSRVLGVTPVGLDDDFFALGGDSIRSIRVSALARERGLTVLLPQIFARRTVRELARALTATAADPEEPLAQVDQLSEGEVDAMLAELLAGGKETEMAP